MSDILSSFKRMSSFEYGDVEHIIVPVLLLLFTYTLTQMQMMHCMCIYFCILLTVYIYCIFCDLYSMKEFNLISLCTPKFA